MLEKHIIKSYKMNCYIGKHIVDFKQAGNVKADYGTKMLLRMSKDLIVKYGKGFSRSNLQYTRLF